MEKINEYLNALPSWKRTNLELFRKLIHEVEPTVVEDWKWNVPVFIFNNKTYFAMSAFKDHTKYNFMINGAMLQDPESLFNNGLESKKSRGIDLREGQDIDEDALRSLIQSSLSL